MIFLTRKGGSLLGTVALWRGLYRLPAGSSVVLWSALRTFFCQQSSIFLSNSAPQPDAARRAATSLRLPTSRYLGRIRPSHSVSFFSLQSFERGMDHVYFPEQLRPPP